ncbi:hypothetical protein M9458_009338, partial [Cirrhinus mrigala]
CDASLASFLCLPYLLFPFPAPRSPSSPLPALVEPGVFLPPVQSLVPSPLPSPTLRSLSLELHLHLDPHLPRLNRQVSRCSLQPEVPPGPRAGQHWWKSPRVMAMRQVMVLQWEKGRVALHCRKEEKTKSQPAAQAPCDL